MSHYAKIENEKVVQIIVAEQDVIDSGIFGTGWIKTSYNTRGNVHYGPDGKPDGGIALRGNYAGIGYIYDNKNDVFYPEKPYSSWILNNQNWSWEAPISMPTDGNLYKWDETSISWVKAETNV
jgi:hypothetical protein